MVKKLLANQCEIQSDHVVLLSFIWEYEIFPHPNSQIRIFFIKINRIDRSEFRHIQTEYSQCVCKRSEKKRHNDSSLHSPKGRVKLLDWSLFEQKSTFFVSSRIKVPINYSQSFYCLHLTVTNHSLRKLAIFGTLQDATHCLRITAMPCCLLSTYRASPYSFLPHVVSNNHDKISPAFAPQFHQKIARSTLQLCLLKYSFYPKFLSNVVLCSQPLFSTPQESGAKRQGKRQIRLNLQSTSISFGDTRHYKNARYCIIIKVINRQHQNAEITSKLGVCLFISQQNLHFMETELEPGFKCVALNVQHILKRCKDDMLGYASIAKTERT